MSLPTPVIVKGGSPSIVDGLRGVLGVGMFAFRCERVEVDSITPELSRQHPGKVELWLHRVFVVDVAIRCNHGFLKPTLLLILLLENS